MRRHKRNTIESLEKRLAKLGREEADIIPGCHPQLPGRVRFRRGGTIQVLCAVCDGVVFEAAVMTTNQKTVRTIKERMLGLGKGKGKRR